MAASEHDPFDKLLESARQRLQAVLQEEKAAAARRDALKSSHDDLTLKFTDLSDQAAELQKTISDAHAHAADVVSRANADAAARRTEAESTAKSMLASAQAERDAMLADAQKQLADTRALLKSTQDELSLAQNAFLNAVANLSALKKQAIDFGNS